MPTSSSARYPGQISSIALLLGLCVFFASCKDVFEEDLAGMAIALVAPTDGWQGSANSITFRWEEVPGATAYQLQLASPDLVRYLDLTLDTQVTALQITTTLIPDSFSWRMRAVNASSSTPWATRRFVIRTDGDLSDQQVPLLLPVLNAYTQEATPLFTWLMLPDADEYIFEVRQGNWAGALVHSDTLTTTTAATPDLPEGMYTWGVQAQNSTTATQFAYRNLTVDQTPPLPPLPLTPANNAQLTDSLVQIAWTPGSDAVSSTIDSMFIFLPGLSTPLRRVATTTGSYSEVLESGTYNWLVRCHDAAGNSAASPLRVFTVQ